MVLVTGGTLDVPRPPRRKAPSMLIFSKVTKLSSGCAFSFLVVVYGTEPSAGWEKGDREEVAEEGGVCIKKKHYPDNTSASCKLDEFRVDIVYINKLIFASCVIHRGRPFFMCGGYTTESM